MDRVCIIVCKAARYYDMAKRIIKLVSAVGDTVNKDLDIGDKLAPVFLSDYNVSSAEIIVLGSELGEHISTAGTEASTSNMKFAMNAERPPSSAPWTAPTSRSPRRLVRRTCSSLAPAPTSSSASGASASSSSTPAEFYKIADQIRSGYFG